MLLIDFGLITLGGLLAYEFICGNREGTWEKLQENTDLQGYKIKSRKATNTGYLLTVEIPVGGCTKKIEDHKEEIENAYKCKCLIRDIIFDNICEIELITKEILGLKSPIMLLTPYELLLGYDFKGEPIIADMSATPHLGVVGTSKMGKSVGIEMGLKAIEDKINITFINTFADKDFTSLKGRRINDNTEMKEYLDNELSDKSWREKPLYIVIDEYNVLSKTVKKIDDTIQGLLAQARHFNVFIICIMQLGNKEDCKFKNLFNCRLAFKTIEKQTIAAFLGTSVDDTNLKRQEFYLYYTDLVRGRTYDKD